MKSNKENIFIYLLLKVKQFHMKKLSMLFMEQKRKMKLKYNVQ